MANIIRLPGTQNELDAYDNASECSDFSIYTHTRVLPQPTVREEVLITKSESADELTDMILAPLYCTLRLSMVRDDQKFVNSEY